MWICLVQNFQKGIIVHVPVFISLLDAKLFLIQLKNDTNSVAVDLHFYVDSGAEQFSDVPHLPFSSSQLDEIENSAIEIGKECDE